jgi:hypothetical protein
MLAQSAVALPQWEEHTVGAGSSLYTFPVDSAASHNSNRGAIRYANPGSNATILTIWNLATAGVSGRPMAGGTIGGTGLLSGEQTSFGSPLAAYQPSDRIQLTNMVGVSIGAGGAAMDETYIEVFDTSTPSLRYQHVEGPPPSGSLDWATLRAGFAHDVAITRDGVWAVVNSDNWIHVVDLVNDIVYPFNIGHYDFSDPDEDPVVRRRPCTPNYAVDSVEVTNDRAVVTTARQHDDPLNPVWTTWVYIVDLSHTSGTPKIVLEHEIVDPVTPYDFPTEFGDWPHDLAISSHTDQLASGVVLSVVATRHSVAAFDLVTNTFLNSYFDKDEKREYQWQVDSVEMTGKMAVVLSDRTGPNGERWQIKFFAVNDSVGLDPTNLPIYTAPDEGELDRAHDLAISRDHDKGLVRTSLHNVVLENLSSPPPAPLALPPILSPNSSDAHQYRNFQSATGHNVFSSDSVLIGTMQTDVATGVSHLMAVTIGATRNSPGQWDGAADVIDLNAATPSVLQQVQVLPNGYGSGGCMPLDLAISFGQSQVVVRSADPQAESNSAAGADLAYITILPVGSIGVATQHGGNGAPMGLDSLAVPPLSGFVHTGRRILSIAQDVFTGLDYVHIAR